MYIDFFQFLSWMLKFLACHRKQQEVWCVYVEYYKNIGTFFDTYGLEWLSEELQRGNRRSLELSFLFLFIGLFSLLLSSYHGKYGSSILHPFPIWGKSRMSWSWFYIIGQSDNDLLLGYPLALRIVYYCQVTGQVQIQVMRLGASFYTYGEEWKVVRKCALSRNYNSHLPLKEPYFTNSMMHIFSPFNIRMKSEYVL